MGPERAFDPDRGHREVTLSKAAGWLDSGPLRRQPGENVWTENLNKK